MAIKISDLDAITTPDDADILHLRNASGLDKKITVADFSADMKNERHTRREALHNSKASTGHAHSFISNAGATDIRFAWQNNIDQLSNAYGYAGNAGKFSILGGGFWLFMELASGVFAFEPPASIAEAPERFPSAVSGDLLVATCFDLTGQYGVVYVERSGTTRFTATSDYGNNWSAYASTTGMTKLNNTETQGNIVYNNGYFYTCDSTNDYFWRASESSPGAFTRITCGSDSGTGTSGVCVSNGKVFLLKTVLAAEPTLDYNYMTPMSTDTVAGTTRSHGMLTGMVAGVPDRIMFKDEGVDQGYYGIQGGNQNLYEAVWYMPTDLSSLTRVDVNKGSLVPMINYGSCFVCDDLKSTVMLARNSGWMFLNGKIIRDAEITEVRYKVTPFWPDSNTTFNFCIARKANGEYSSAAMAYYQSIAGGGRIGVIVVNDEAVALANNEITLVP